MLICRVSLCLYFFLSFPVLSSHVLASSRAASIYSATTLARENIFFFLLSCIFVWDWVLGLIWCVVYERLYVWWEHQVIENKLIARWRLQNNDIPLSRAWLPNRLLNPSIHRHNLSRSAFLLVACTCDMELKVGASTPDAPTIWGAQTGSGVANRRLLDGVCLEGLDRAAGFGRATRVSYHMDRHHRLRPTRRTPAVDTIH